MKTCAFLLVLFAFANGKELAPSARLAPIQKILVHLRSADGFHSSLVKKVRSGQLGSKTESKGEIYFAKGKMRLELTSPERSLLVFDGDQAWQEQEFDDGDKKRAIVTKLKAKSIRKDSALLAALLGDGDVLKGFKVSKATKSGDLMHFELRPKNKKASDVTSLKIDAKDAVLKSIAYVDTLDNEVSFFFDNLKEEKIPDKKFQYQPPKGAEVSEL